MLAATRDQATTLNTRAQTHTHHPPRPTPHPPPGGAVPAGGSVRLGDGTHAYVGDLVITRRNNRALRTSATDFVKNGDRWRVTHTHPDGRLTVTHQHTRARLTLPANYVAHWVDLGYATTINTAQGVTADTSHTLLTGAESREQMYTALTRGRHANHAYLHVVGAGDPHTLIHPTTTHPVTPTEILAGILARDTTARSVTTHRRDQHDPRALIADAADRYLDALHVAADTTTPHTVRDALDSGADQLHPHLTSAPAWPTLRAHLLLHHTAGGPHPLTTLTTLTRGRDLADAADPAAVLHWRLHPHPSDEAGPLPWLPPIPRPSPPTRSGGPI